MACGRAGRERGIVVDTMKFSTLPALVIAVPRVTVRVAGLRNFVEEHVAVESWQAMSPWRASLQRGVPKTHATTPPGLAPVPFVHAYVSPLHFLNTGRTARVQQGRKDAAPARVRAACAQEAWINVQVGCEGRTLMGRLGKGVVGVGALSSVGKDKVPAAPPGTTRRRRAVGRVGARRGYPAVR